MIINHPKNNKNSFRECKRIIKVSSTGKIYKSLRKAFENATFSDDENKKIKSLVNALWIRAEELKEQFEQMTRCLIEEVENNLHTMQDYDMNMLSITDFSSNGLPYYTSNDSLIRELVGNRCYFDILAEIEEMEKKSKESVMQICKEGLFDWKEDSIEQFVDYIINVPEKICTLNLQYKGISEYKMEVKLSYDQEHVVLT